MKRLGEKAIFNRLQKKLDSMYSKEQQEELGFYTDIDRNNTYAWDIEEAGRRFQLVIDKMTGKIIIS